MASFSYGNTVFSPNFYQRVYIDTVYRPDIQCLSVPRQIGTGGSQASFIAPNLDWDGGKKQFRGKFVKVAVAYSGQSFQTVFSGYISEVPGASSDRMISLTALSLMGWADSFTIGEADLSENAVASYPEFALNDSGVWEETGWSVKSIIRDFFSSSLRTWRNGEHGNGTLHSSVRSRLKLGSLAPLSDSYNKFPIGDITFRQSSLRDGLDQLLGLVGTISFRQRFEGNETFLDFFELADPSAPSKTLRVAQQNESIAGTNVAEISHSETGVDVKTKMIGIGDNRKCVVTITSTDALIQDWDSDDEAAVLNNLEAAQDGNNSGAGLRSEFSPAKEKVFRSYRIAPAFKRFMIDKDNAITLTDGSKIPIQVFLWENTLAYSSGWTVTAKTIPTLIGGAELDVENLRLRLAKPAVKAASISTSAEGDQVINWAEARVGITFTVNVQTLQSVKVGGNLELDGIDRLTEPIENSSFKYIQTTNDNYPIGGVEYDCLYYIEGTGWTTNTTPTILRDDSARLDEFTELALREKNRIVGNYTITLPFFSNAYKEGQKVVIIGQNDFEYGTHQITSINHTLGNDHRTILSTDTSVPMIASEILSTEGGE